MPCIVTRALNRHLAEIDRAESKEAAIAEHRARFTVETFFDSPEDGIGYRLLRDGVEYDCDPGPFDTHTEALAAGERQADSAAETAAKDDEIAAAESAAY